jgi:hypothetical protein
LKVDQTAHREQQFEIHDLRRRLINGTQVETFGFTSDSHRPSRIAKGVTFLHSRAVDANSDSGDIAHSTLFACGDLEGRVSIWDLRNIKQPATQVNPRSPATGAGF